MNDQPNKTASNPTHQEIGAAWEIVAQTGYGSEIAQDVAFLKEGGSNLMEPERHLLSGLDQWCECAIHLQCSAGKELLSLWNMGAKRVIGIDISKTLIGYAQQKAAQLQAPATWYCCDVLDPPQSLNNSADLVYTGRGALMWIMDLAAWASVVLRLLKPNGRVLIYEGHPLDNLWQREADTLVLRPGVSYFAAEPRENPGFPAAVVINQTGDNPNRPQMVERYWRPGEVINALVTVGLDYIYFEEYPDLFWNQFHQMSSDITRCLPHTYAIVMQKKVSS